MTTRKVTSCKSPHKTCSTQPSLTPPSNAINGTNVYVIYAQTPKFYVTGGPCEDAPTPVPTCAAATTVTVTVSTTLVSGAASVVTVFPTVHFTAPGKCPDTIGWGSSGYNCPVTLSKVPHGPANPKPTKAPAGAWSSRTDAATSTIYQTVYKDMSEVDDFCRC